MLLFITIDTLRADYLSCYGRKTISTPPIDGLAARGVRCAQAIAQVPLTAPSHASILTGAYPQVHGVRDMGGFVLDSKYRHSPQSPARRDWTPPPSLEQPC